MWITGLFFIFIHMHFAQCAPLPKEIVDLTHVFNNDTLHHPIHRKFEIKVHINESFGDYWVLTEEYSSGSHAGTHMDAPRHIVPGKWTIDQIPLDRFFAPAAVVDVEQKCESNHDYEVTVSDLMEWETKTGQTLNDVVLLIRTGWSKKWHNKDLYFGTNETDMMKLHNPGMSKEGAEWLVANRNIIGIGIDTVSFDVGAALTLKAHGVLLNENIYGLENLDNLDKLPLFGAKLYIMPMKIGSASGAPARVIATFPILVHS